MTNEANQEQNGTVQQSNQMTDEQISNILGPEGEQQIQQEFNALQAQAQATNSNNTTNNQQVAIAQYQQEQQQQKEEKGWFERNWDWLLSAAIALGIGAFAYFKIDKYKDKTKETQQTNSQLQEKISSLTEEVSALTNTSNSTTNTDTGSTLSNNSTVYTQDTVDQINKLLAGSNDRLV